MQEPKVVQTPPETVARAQVPLATLAGKAGQAGWAGHAVQVLDVVDQPDQEPAQVPVVDVKVQVSLSVIVPL